MYIPPTVVAMHGACCGKGVGGGGGDGERVLKEDTLPGLGLGVGGV